MKSTETVNVDSKKVTCDGGSYKHMIASKHPLIYLDMGEKHNVTCPYCSKHFVLRNNLTHKDNKN